MMRRSLFEHVAVPVAVLGLALAAGCFLDTTPIAGTETSTGGNVLSDAGSSVSKTLPAQATGLTPVTVSPDAAVLDGSLLPLDASSLPPSAPASSTPSAMADAGTATAPAMQCQGAGSYGLRARLDVTWDATAWFDVGRGTLELLGLLETEAVDPHTLSAKFRVCGLSLPKLDSSAVCSSYQLQFPESTWDGSQLPEQPLSAELKCDTSGCVLQLDPISYTLGIRLADAQAPWPALEDIKLSQFADDDADGVAGVSVDVMSQASVDAMSQASVDAMSQASVAWGQDACSPSNGPSQQGQQGPGNSTNTGMPGSPGNGSPPGQTTPPAMLTSLGHFPVGLRSQLTAALRLTPDCELTGATASGGAFSLHAAGCFVGDGADPASAAMTCSEELRAGIDESLPRYRALAEGEKPASSSTIDGRASAGTIVQAVRLELDNQANQGSQVGCDDVRSAKF